MLISEFTKEIWPRVDERLEKYRTIAQNAPDTVLREQALSSLKMKRFHALGGSIYALYPGAEIEGTLRFITALQTISDYLDNLCDRANVTDEKAFRQLHRAMLDAVTPASTVSDYYLHYPHRADGGYLSFLVMECREVVEKLPSYSAVEDKIILLLQLYIHLQAYKHIDVSSREEKLTNWAMTYKDHFPDISTWEFSAAAGTTLGIFVLLAAAHKTDFTREEANVLAEAYFPYISALHILLDYYIDAQEDLDFEDLNFTFYYNNIEECEQRLAYFIRQSLKRCRKLRYPHFHLTVLRGILAMYLSDPKAGVKQMQRTSRSLVKAGGVKTCVYYRLCRLLRKRGKL